MTQRKADRNRVTSASRFIDGPLHASDRLIGEATQPQAASEVDERGDTLIKTKGVNSEGIKLDRECHAALKMELCRGLVAQKVVSTAYPTLRPDCAGRVLGGPRDDADLLPDRQGAADVANPQKKCVQPDEKAD